MYLLLKIYIFLNFLSFYDLLKRIYKDYFKQNKFFLRIFKISKIFLSNFKIKDHQM